MGSLVSPGTRKHPPHPHLLPAQAQRRPDLNKVQNLLTPQMSPTAHNDSVSFSSKSTEVHTWEQAQLATGSPPPCFPTPNNCSDDAMGPVPHPTPGRLLILSVIIPMSFQCPSSECRTSPPTHAILQPQPPGQPPSLAAELYKVTVSVYPLSTHPLASSNLPSTPVTSLTKIALSHP